MDVDRDLGDKYPQEREGLRGGVPKGNLPMSIELKQYFQIIILYKHFILSLVFPSPNH